MRRVSTSFLQPGMKGGRPIYSSEGRVLLGTGITLSQKYIDRLTELGIGSIYIKDDLLNIEEVPDIVSEQTRRESVQLVKESFSSLKTKRHLNMRAVKKVVDSLIDEVLESRDVLLNFLDIRSYDDYTFSHSVNVCILSIMSGLTLGYHQLKLKELGIGALLHDIGKTLIDKDLLNKPDTLTPTEYDQIKLHAQNGFEILRGYDEVPLLSAHVTFQHHEKFNGQGYPRGLSGEAIHEYARIVTVADVFDALVADRPYRPGYSNHQALTIMQEMAEDHFDRRVFKSLTCNVAVWPVGTVVILNVGEIGVVARVNKDNPTRPVVKIIMDKNRTLLKKQHEVDLAALRTIYISEVLLEAETNRLLNHKLFSS